MAHHSKSQDPESEQALHPQACKRLLRVITCGSAGSGKSTLISRLLDAAPMRCTPPPAAPAADAKTWRIQGARIDFAPLPDEHTAAERGLTSELAFRFFATDTRTFIVADTSGCEPHTRDMIIGASAAELAVLAIDARRGLLTQTHRHSYLLSLLGIGHIVVAVNKMDLVDYAEAAFARIVDEYRAFAQKIGLERITFIPTAALHGDNITRSSARMPWYHGPTLLGYLEAADVDECHACSAPFRLPLQTVSGPDPDVCGLSGTIVSGAVRPGDRIRLQPSGRASRVARILTPAGELAEAYAGQSIALTLSDELDILRDELISAADAPAEVADQFAVTLVWLHGEPMLAGRPYLMKTGAATVTATVTAIKHQINVTTLEHVAARQLELNGIAECNLSVDRPIAFDPYATNRDTGSFVLIDRLTGHTVGAGMIRFALRRAHNIHLQHVDIDKAARAALKGQKPCVLWLTGLSGAGKSTIANLVERRLHAMGRHTYLLDGDNIRHGLNRDLGFTDADRVENIRRVAEVARLMVDAGLIVITAFISPFRSERLMARSLFETGEFIEVFVNTPLEVAEARDPKGLYKKARRGELKNFTGIDSPYEAPEAPEIDLDTRRLTADEAAQTVLLRLQQAGYV